MLIDQRYDKLDIKQVITVSKIEQNITGVYPIKSNEPIGWFSLSRPPLYVQS